MRKLVSCPRCDDILITIRDKSWLRYLCRECGWSYTFMPVPPNDELDAALIAVIEAWKNIAATDSTQ